MLIALLLVSAIAIYPLPPDYEWMRRSTVVVHQVYKGDPVGHGAGVLIEQGVLTAGHVAEAVPDEGHLAVELYDGQRVRATVERSEFGGTSETLTKDLALLSIPTRHGHPTASVSCEPPAVGTMLHIVGHPGGLPWAVTSGSIVTDRGSDTWIVTDALLPHGHSGGPMFTRDGAIAGIVSSVEAARFTITGYHSGVSPSAICRFLGTEP